MRRVQRDAQVTCFGPGRCKLGLRMLEDRILGGKRLLPGVNDLIAGVGRDFGRAGEYGAGRRRPGLGAPRALFGAVGAGRRRVGEEAAHTRGVLALARFACCYSERGLGGPDAGLGVALGALGHQRSTQREGAECDDSDVLEEGEVRQAGYIGILPVVRVGVEIRRARERNVGPRARQSSRCVNQSCE